MADQAKVANAPQYARTHGMTYSSEFVIWCGMRRRCVSKTHPAFKDYGGRGISVCSEWSGRKGFQNFIDDMGHRPDGCSLDRKDNNKDYTPENCRWATAKEQANNRRSNRLLTILGVEKTLSQWIDDSGIKPSTVKQRFYVYGWSIERSLGLNEGGIAS